MSRILITGSQGTLGIPLVAELQRRGQAVFQTDLSHRSIKDYMRADISKIRQLERVFIEHGPFDYVYHLAAEFGRMNGDEYYENLWMTNVVGTRNVLHLQQKLRFRLIFASSSEVYGEVTDGEVLSEDMTDTKPLFHFNDYAMSNWVNEQQIRNASARYGTETMRLRFFNAYGPGEHYHPYRSVVCLFCFRALARQPFTVYRGYHRVFMYVGDFITTLANASQRFIANGIINIGGDEYRSVEDLAKLIIEQTDCPRILVRYEAKEDFNVVNKRPDIEKAKLLLGHDPKVRLEEGVELTLDWMREVYDFD